MYHRTRRKILTLLCSFAVLAAGLPAVAQDAADKPGANPADDLPAATAVKYRVVPNIQGKYPALARQLLRIADLQFSQGVFYIAPQNWRDDIRPGVIYLQVPPPKAPLAPSGTVAGWMFAKAGDDQEIIEMPDLKGMNGAAVRDKLKELNLSLMQRSSVPGDSKVVGDQYPRPGQQIYQQTSVQLRWNEDSP